MPVKWGSRGLTESGFRGIVYFRGRWVSTEEDLPSKYTEKDGTPKTQAKFNFANVEILAFESAITVNDGKLGQYYNYSRSKSSVWGKLQIDLEKFADDARFAEHLEGPLPDAFYGVDLIWARKFYPMGGDSQPGMAFVPIDLGENHEKYAKGQVEGGSIDVDKEASGSKSSGPSVPDSLPDELVALVKKAAKDGATESVIRKAILKGSGEDRKAMSDAGGVESVIAFLLANDHLVADGDDFIAVDTEDEQPAEVAAEA